jgi:hypothetical protein
LLQPLLNEAPTLSLQQQLNLCHLPRLLKTCSMWAGGAVARRRRAVSPPFYNGYDALDIYRNYPAYDALSPAYGYNYPLNYNMLALGEHVTSPTQAVEVATRHHVNAQKEHEKAKEKYEEAKKKMEEYEQKMKQAEELLRATKVSAMYAS